MTDSSAHQVDRICIGPIKSVHLVKLYKEDSGHTVFIVK